MEEVSHCPGATALRVVEIKSHDLEYYSAGRLTSTMVASACLLASPPAGLSCCSYPLGSCCPPAARKPTGFTARGAYHQVEVLPASPPVGPMLWNNTRNSQCCAKCVIFRNVVPPTHHLAKLLLDGSGYLHQTTDDGQSRKPLHSQATDKGKSKGSRTKTGSRRSQRGKNYRKGRKKTRRCPRRQKCYSLCPLAHFFYLFI